MTAADLRGNWWGLGFMSLAVLVVALDLTVLTIALPTISRSLHAGTSQLQWVLDSYTLAGASAMLPAGTLADRFGRRGMLIAGLVLFGGASVCSALSGSVGELIAARTVQGVGAGILLPIPLAIIAATFDEELRSKAVGISTAAVAGGMPFGPIVGGLLLQHFSWRSVFWINVPVIVVSVIGCLRTIPETRNPSAPRLDFPGAVLAVGGIVALVYGLIQGPRNGWSDPVTVGLLAAALVLGVLFVGQERRIAEPMVDFMRFGDRRFAWGTAACVAGTIALSLTLFLTPTYLESVLGNSAIGTGIRLLPIMAGMFLGGSLAPVVNRWIGSKLTVSGGLVLTAFGLVVLAMIRPDRGYLIVGAGFVIFGVGAGSALAVAMDTAIGAVGGGETGTGAALANTLRQIGGAIAYAAGGGIVVAVYASHLTPALAGLAPSAASASRASVAEAVAVAGRLGAPGAALRHAAGSAYAAGVSAALFATAGLCLVTAMLCLRFLPALGAKDSEATQDSPASNRRSPGTARTPQPSSGHE